MEYKIFQFVDHTLAFASATSSGGLSEKSFVLFIQYHLVARSGAWRPKNSHRASLAKLCSPETHEIDLWQV